MGDVGIGRVLLLGVVLSPVYLMLIRWFVGRPRQLRLPLVGIGLLAGFTALSWGGMAVFAWMVGATFFEWPSARIPPCRHR
jgi:hypothetical protein